jgi:tRNA threonylcarbamoyladenosine biosynthesis protein TsaE
MGPLGAGKTCFAKGVISQLTGTPVSEITSPTFTLVEEYEGNQKVYHVDLYRIDDAKQMEALPVEDWFDPMVITLVEWPENAPELPQDCQYLIKFTKWGETERQMEYQKRLA